MNVENVLKVADAIEQRSVPDLGFNMGLFVGSDLPDFSGHNCGTAACIGGWALAVESRLLSADALLENYTSFGRTGYERAAPFLGLSESEAWPLFFPVSAEVDPYDATPNQAVRVLRILAITGKVDWEAAMDPREPELPALPSPAKASTTA